MSDDILRSSEESASAPINNNQIISNVIGKKQKIKSPKKIASLGAMGFITVMLLIVAFLFSSGNLIPAAISNRLIEETDVQYADAVQSKEIVFQQALREGDIPDNTTELLAQSGVTVGYMSNGEFVEGNQVDGSLVLKMDDKIITADQFVDEANSNVKLYDAFNRATYSRAAYYYDDSAKEVFKEVGTSRNNYNSDTDLQTVMSDKMGKGSNITVNNQKKGEDSSDDTSNDPVAVGDPSQSSGSASDFVSGVGKQNSAGSTDTATLGAADEIKAADTISKEQRSALYYALFMENISKMQAGDGDDSQIHEAMNFLYQEETTKVVDVNTGEEIEVKGTPLESPSLYSILAGDKMDAKSVENYSSDRVLVTVQNQLDQEGSDSDIIDNTITSTSTGRKGLISRSISLFSNQANQDTLNKVTPTVSDSLVDNSYDTIKGIYAGELLAEGAVNLGKELAKYSGATAGSAEAVAKYMKLNSDVLAMDAKVDRMNRSPFDITSKNTFLGSIIYNFAIGLRLNSKSNSLLTGLGGILKTVGRSIASIIPATRADAAEGYLATFGDCQTIGRIGAVGSSHCSMIATFDTSTLDDPLNNQVYKRMQADWTDDDGITVKANTALTNFIKNNIKRKTPVGITDGGILVGGTEDTKENESVSFVSSVVDMVKAWWNNSTNNKTARAASGELFVNSSSNADWETYKWAQRYVSLTRAADSLKQYAVNYDGRMAYNFGEFAWEENPVLAYIHEYIDNDTEIANY